MQQNAMSSPQHGCGASSNTTWVEKCGRLGLCHSGIVQGRRCYKGAVATRQKLRGTTQLGTKLGRRATREATKARRPKCATK